MTQYIRDVDVETFAREPSGLALVVSAESAQGTSGGYHGERLLLSEAGADALQAAMHVAHSAEPGSLRAQATELIATLSLGFLAAESYGLDPGHVPQLHAKFPDDDSLLFEWILPNFRLGFGLEKDRSQSSWFLVTDETLGNISSSGYLSGIELQKLILWLMGFLVQHS